MVEKRRANRKTAMEFWWKKAAAMPDFLDRQQ